MKYNYTVIITAGDETSAHNVTASDSREAIIQALKQAADSDAFEEALNDAEFSQLLPNTACYTFEAYGEDFLAVAVQH